MELGRVGVTPVIDDPAAPIYRMRTAAGHLLDLMPANAGVLGFGNEWFEPGYDRAITVEIGVERPLRIFPARICFAAKVEAHQGGGIADPWMSHDLEDILTLVACRASLIAELQAEPETVKDFLRNAAKKLLGLKRLDELIHVRTQEPDA